MWPVLWKKNVENSLSISQTIAWLAATQNLFFERPVENRKNSTKKNILLGGERWVFGGYLVLKDSVLGLSVLEGGMSTGRCR
ncbi:MAG TPA: hypothetical protein PKC65_01140 [Pyrinomonadaceae bacterium]|nr:hypothetical protein [Pyrinomonadaceae bacterium]HMU33324.1 hypothetical protein [Pyrinomonadaceae bacterium]